MVARKGREKCNDVMQNAYTDEGDGGPHPPMAARSLDRM
jgi:hypothetical protein